MATWLAGEFSSPELTLYADSYSKKSQTELTARVFNWMKQDKHANFRGSPLFQAMYNTKTEKQTIIQLILCQVDAQRLVEGKGYKTDWRDKEEGVI